MQRQECSFYDVELSPQNLYFASHVLMKTTCTLLSHEQFVCTCPWIGRGNCSVLRSNGHTQKHERDTEQMTHEHTQEHGIKSGANTQHTGQRARGGYTNARTRGGRHASPPSYPPGSARAWSGCRPTKARVTQVVHTKESVRACMVKSPKHASHTGSVVARVYPGMLRQGSSPCKAVATSRTSKGSGDVVRRWRVVPSASGVLAAVSRTAGRNETKFERVASYTTQTG